MQLELIRRDNYGTEFKYRVIYLTAPPPKNHKFKKKSEYLDWPSPKSSKCQLVSKHSKKKVKVLGLGPP